MSMRSSVGMACTALPAGCRQAVTSRNSRNSRRSCCCLSYTARPFYDLMCCIDRLTTISYLPGLLPVLHCKLQLRITRLPSLGAHGRPKKIAVKQSIGETYEVRRCETISVLEVQPAVVCCKLMRDLHKAQTSLLVRLKVMAGMCKKGNQLPAENPPFDEEPGRRPVSH